ncbi:MAG: hypothetical protein WAL71_17570 [Terriglobales bacterium]|jgi:CheY-like chemotaxis protein
MFERLRKKYTILHFCCDDAGLLRRAESLRRSGYRVLFTGNGFETVELCTREPVDAVVLELDRNGVEVALIAQEIKRRHPKLPTIMLTESTAPGHAVHELADALVPKENSPELLKSLQKVLLPGVGAAI